MTGLDALTAGVGQTDQRDARHAVGGLLAAQGPTALDVRTGVMWGPGSTQLVTGTSKTGPKMSVLIGVHVGIGSRGTANGPYLGPTLDAPVEVDVELAPASGSRIDVVYERQRDMTSGVPSPDASPGPEYGVLRGNSTGGIPAKPDLSTIVGAVELATVLVQAGATSTNGANVTITNTARQVTARGTDVVVRNQSERDALETFPLLTVKRLDTGTIEMRNLTDTAWVTLYDPAGTAAPGCELSGAQATIPNNAWTNITWATEIANPRKMHAAGASRVTVPEPRFYTVTATLYWDSNSSGRRGIRVVVNDDGANSARTRETIIGAVNNTRTNVSTGVWLTAGQYVGIQAFQDSGGSVGLTAANCYMAVVPGPVS